MMDRIMAKTLASTYRHRLTAFRPLAEGGEERLCEAAECALSRAAHTSAPTPPKCSQTLPEAAYRLSLFTRPELRLRLGDRLEITDEWGECCHAVASDSYAYPSHCVTVVEVRRIEDRGGADSREACPNGEVSR